MRLFLTVHPQLNKAGREGLVPVERQVLRGGKSFRQIFYVRPSRAESEKEAGKIQDPETFHTPPIKGGSPDNRPQGGFWIGLRSEGETVGVRVPQKHIDRVFTWAGHKFVVHRRLNMKERRWTAQYHVSEVTTGMSIGAETNPDPEKAWKLGMQQLEKVGKQKLDNAITDMKDNLEKIDEKNFHGITDHWDAAEIVTPKAINQLVNNLVHFSDEAISRKDIEAWLETHYEFDETGDIDDLLEEIEDQWVLEQAINYDKPYALMAEEEEGVADMVDVLGGLGLTVDYFQIREWAEKHDYDLARYDRSDWGVEISGGNYEEPEQVMYYAINNDVSFETAQGVMLQALRDQEEEMAEEETGITTGEIPDKGDRRPYQDFDPAKKEKLLTSNEEAERARLGGGINGSYWVRLANGEDIEGVWKPAHEEHGGARSNIHEGTYYLREAVAWEIDKAMGLGMVPPTVIQQIDGNWGSVQEFAGDAYTSSEKSIEDNDDMYAASVFDFITLNTDRHGANYMISEDGRPILIDNGLILPTDDDALGNPFYNSHFYHSGPLPEAVMTKVEDADWSKVVNWMVDHGIEDSAIDSFTQRLAWLMDNKSLPTSNELGYSSNDRPWSSYPSRSGSVLTPKEREV